MKRIILAAVVLCCFTACKDKKNDMVVGTSADYKPFMFYDNGVLTGFEKDVFDEVAKRLDRAPVYKDMSFDGLIGGLQTGRLDVAAACMTKTEERAKNVDFSEPYYVDQAVALVKNDHNFNTVNDLKGQNVGVQMGTIYEMYTQLWQKEGSVAHILSLSKIPELVQAWRSGRIVAIIMGSSEAKSVAESQPDMKIVSLGGLSKSFVSFALPKNSDYTSKINDVLASMGKDGTLAQLLEKWKL